MPEDEAIEQWRDRFKHSGQKTAPNTLGAGSRIRKGPLKVSRIAGRGITSSKYSRLWQCLIRYFKAKHIIEMGTSLGINTLYLAKSRKDTVTITFEGSQDLVPMAASLFGHFPDNDIRLIPGNIDETLPAYLEQRPAIDFVLFDANHTMEATLRYYQLIKKQLKDTAILVFDDIYWSAEMHKTWKMIVSDNQQHLCLDLFQAGVVLMKKGPPAGYYRLAF